MEEDQITGQVREKTVRLIVKFAAVVRVSVLLAVIVRKREE